MNPRLSIILPTHLKERILQFAFNPNYKTFFIANAKGDTTDPWKRRFCNLNTDNHPDPELAQLIRDFATQAYAQLGIDEFRTEHLFGNFVGVNTHGGSVHQHKDDPDEDGFIHVRMNFLIQKPLSGGNPIIDDVEYEMLEGQSWINYASEWNHASTPVSGTRERVTLSLGAYIHPTLVEKITKGINRETDYSKLLRPQTDLYDIYFFRDLKRTQGWKQYEYPQQLLKFNNNICVLPTRKVSDLTTILQYDFTKLNDRFASTYPDGYRNVTSLVDIITFHLPNGNENLSGQVLNSKEFGYDNVWGVLSSLTNNPNLIITNLLHELMHWKLVALGFGTGPNQFFPTTQEFILNDETELCWSIVNSYADTAQPAVGNKPTDRPVSASLHAYVSFLAVAYTYLQVLKTSPSQDLALSKVKQWGSRFDKCYNELLRVGRFTDKGDQLMRGIGEWTLDFYKEYNSLY